MKAIKLASVFAVTAVAAAVSTTTFAAEAIITGEAGLEYVNFSSDSTKSTSLSGNKAAELELQVDTGIVYAELEFKTTGTDSKNNDADESVIVGLEKIYVKQGAVSFGRFDGSVSTGAFMGMDEIQSGVDLNTALGTNGDTDDTGLRYKVTPELTVAIEATEATATEDSDVGVAASYVHDFGGFKVGISGGAIGDASAANIGAQTVVGPATLSLNYGSGKTGNKVGTNVTKDVELMTASVAVAATEALTLTLEYSQDLETAKEPTGTYFVGEYAVGDLTYYVKNYNGDLVGNADERTIVGVKAAF
tara:strand:- start:42 stop:956 length:915 start_codon:yes stop_codon:yes gene_type:complete